MITLTKDFESGMFLSDFSFVWFIDSNSNAVNSSKNFLSSSVNESIVISSNNKLLY